MFATHQSSVRALALLIGVNLSSNAYPTSILPHPQPLPDALGRGGFAPAKPGWGNADLDDK
ncbi:hypothetical protein NIES25_12680 [Nostoc linckia NIES-25]|nr:hypothetical protein NIES25_12680 [Nostoc linckia NIES-25]